MEKRKLPESGLQNGENATRKRKNRHPLKNGRKGHHLGVLRPMQRLQPGLRESFLKHQNEEKLYAGISTTLNVMHQLPQLPKKDWIIAMILCAWTKKLDLVHNFYERNDISRQAPGRRDVITVREGKGKKGKKIQARHLTSILETHALFCKEYPDVKVGKSKFAELRPKHVQLSSKLPHNVCLCKYHENFIMAINALHKASSSCPSYSHELPERFLCSEPKRACWMNECNSCKDGAGFRRIMNYDTADAQWYVWKTAEDNRLMKAVEEGTTHDLVDYICSLMPQFLEHTYIKRHQASEYQTCKERATNNTDPEEALIQVDFSENYTCVAQDVPTALESKAG